MEERCDGTGGSILRSCHHGFDGWYCEGGREGGREGEKEGGWNESEK